MFWRLPFMFTCLIFFQNIARAQFIYYDRSPATDWDEINRLVASARDLQDSLQGLGYVAEGFFIHEISGEKWMTIDGRFDVYEWQSDQWKNLYEGTYHGYNYMSHKFVYDEKLFSYKGYGYWREHGEIIEFLPAKGGWEIIPDSRDLPYGVGYMVDSLFYIHSDACYNVHLIDQTVKNIPCVYSIRDEVPTGRAYIFEDYTLIASVLDDGTHYPLIEKNSGEVYLSRRQPFNGLREPSTVDAIIHMKGNQMTILRPDSTSVQYTVDEELQYYIQEPKEARQAFSWFWWALIGGSLVVLGAMLVRSKKKPVVQGNTSPLLPFKGYDGKLIDSDELDKILGIDEVPVYETRKHKRALLIRELNSLSKQQFGHELIVRKKNPLDKRFYQYKIQYNNI